MFKYISLYFLTFIFFLAIDFVWLNFIAKDLYQKEIGTLLLKNPNLLPALIFYLLFVLAIVVILVVPGIKEGDLVKTLIFAALFGLTTYATYDLTNLATLNGWSIKITIIDLIWGTSISTITALVGFYIGSKII
ncbi:MAG: DUF2177 family protein [Candidatus Dojkabacteria bacterium]|jgi:uncharacterized membrane protein|nr:DUF2177 family protein [Candidatus Dojkabacteria bacterium]